MLWNWMVVSCYISHTAREWQCLSFFLCVPVLCLSFFPPFPSGSLAFVLLFVCFSLVVMFLSVTYKHFCQLMLLNIGALDSSCAFRDVTFNYYCYKFVNECYWKDLEINVILNWIEYCISCYFREGFIFANFASQTLAKISTSIHVYL